MKICWDNLEKLKYSKRTGKWRGNTTYICYRNCGESYLSAEKSTGNFCSLKYSTNTIHNSMYGKKRVIPDETKKKMSEVHKGHIVTYETARKISQSLKGKKLLKKQKEK